MRAFVAFFKKEMMEAFRSGKLLLLGILFLAFGVMNPAIAKITPWLMDLLSEEMAEIGMTVIEVQVDALTSWTQFFKNIPMALIAFVFIYGSVFTREYEKGTLVLVLTKGLARYKVVLAKTLATVLVWTLGYWLCFSVTYAYNAYFWDNSIAHHLLPAVLYWWIFGIFISAMIVFFSVLLDSYGGVLLATGGVVLASNLLEMIPKLADFVPTALMNGAGALIFNTKAPSDYLIAFVIALAVSMACIAVSIPLFNKKQI